MFLIRIDGCVCLWFLLGLAGGNTYYYKWISFSWFPYFRSEKQGFWKVASIKTSQPRQEVVPSRSRACAIKADISSSNDPKQNPQPRFQGFHSLSEDLWETGRISCSGESFVKYSQKKLIKTTLFHFLALLQKYKLATNLGRSFISLFRRKWINCFDVQPKFETGVEWVWFFFLQMCTVDLELRICGRYLVKSLNVL